MADKLDKISGLETTWERFSLFTKTKWRASLLAVLMIALLGGIFLLLFYGYKKIDLLGQELNKGVEILEDSHTTTEELQKDFEASVYDNILIEKKMTECVFSHNADAMLVFKFHDSRTDLQGKHDFFYSATNEVMKPGIPSLLPNIQQIPVVRLGEFVTPMIENKCQVVYTDSISGNSWLKDRLTEQNVQGLVSCPIYDIEDNLLGFTELVYLDGTTVPIGDDFSDVLTCFKHTTEEISTIIQKERQ